MGARHAEFALGFWLLLSPILFGHVDRTGLLLHDLVVGTLVMTLALLCYAPRLRRAHLGQLVFAASLTAFGWWTQRHDPSGAAENHVLVGLTLAMVALVPSRACMPPRGWRGEDPGDDGKSERPDVQTAAEEGGGDRS